MGWKKVKEHYRIGHSVHVTDKGICIGSAYIHDIIVISSDEKILKRHDGRDDELTRYQREIASNSELFRGLAESPDEFSASLVVYTYADGEIIEKLCETPGWPNVTHDGEMMYDNSFSPDKEKVVAWAKRETAHCLRYAEEAVLGAKKRLAECQERRTKVAADLAKLEADFPATTSLPANH